MSAPKLHSAGELEQLVQDWGLLPFFRCGIPGFSVEDCTPARYWFVEGVDGPWEWRMEVARRGVVAYGKLFRKKAGLVSRDWYPDLANYRRDGYDFDARYEEGKAGRREKAIMDALLQNGPMLSRDLKRAAGFDGGGLKGFDTADESAVKKNERGFITFISTVRIADDVSAKRSLQERAKHFGSISPKMKITTVVITAEAETAAGPQICAAITAESVAQPMFTTLLPISSTESASSKLSRILSTLFAPLLPFEARLIICILFTEAKDISVPEK